MPFVLLHNLSEHNFSFCKVRTKPHNWGLLCSCGHIAWKVLWQMINAYFFCRRLTLVHYESTILFSFLVCSHNSAIVNFDVIYLFLENFTHVYNVFWSYLLSFYPCFPRPPCHPCKFIFFVFLPIFSWVQGHLLSIGNLLDVSPLKNGPPSLNSHQMPMLSATGMTDIRSPFPIHVQMLTGLIVCRSCASNHIYLGSLRKWARTLYFTAVLPDLCVLQHYIPSSRVFSEPGRKEVLQKLMKLSTPQSLILYTLTSCELLY